QAQLQRRQIFAQPFVDNDADRPRQRAADRQQFTRTDAHECRTLPELPDSGQPQDGGGRACACPQGRGMIRRLIRAGGRPPGPARAPRAEPGQGARQADLVRRVRFLVALARCLHRYGAPAPRLENAINDVARLLGLVCNINSNPTSIVLSCREPGGPESMLNEITRVVRLEPGGVDLRRMVMAGAVAEPVLDGRRDVEAGCTLPLAVEALPVRG